MFVKLDGPDRAVRVRGLSVENDVCVSHNFGPVYWAGDADGWSNVRVRKQCGCFDEGVVCEIVITVIALDHRSVAQRYSASRYHGTGIRWLHNDGHRSI